jgi:hypothetical protein
MKAILFITSGVCLAAVAIAAAPAPAQAKTMKECAAEWKQMKADNKTGGMKYRDFSKQCMSGSASTAPTEAAKPAATTPPAATAAPEITKKQAKPAAAGSPGRQAMYARERACGKEWKADKAAGKIQAGMKWPQYWHECDQRKKAQGM